MPLPPLFDQEARGATLLSAGVMLMAPVKSVLAAQTIKLQAQTLAEDCGIRRLVLNYDAMRGIECEGMLF